MEGKIHGQRTAHGVLSRGLTAIALLTVFCLVVASLHRLVFSHE